MTVFHDKVQLEFIETHGVFASEGLQSVSCLFTLCIQELLWFSNNVVFHANMLSLCDNDSLKRKFVRN